MRKAIIEAVTKRLNEKVPEILFIDIWNTELTTLPGGALWPTPAVFIEFDEIEWHQENRGARRADVEVRLHLITRHVPAHGGTDERQKYSLAFFDLIDKMNAALQDLKTENLAGFMLTRSITNHYHSELLESIEYFTTSAQDVTAMPKIERAYIDDLKTTRG